MKTKAAQPVLPFGVITLVLVASIWFWQTFWGAASDACHELETQLRKGYFLAWQAPSLVLVTADKKQFTVTADSRVEACQKMQKQLPAINPPESGAD